MILIKKLNLDMRHIVLLLSYFFILQSFSQVSYDFSEALPLDENPISSVSSSDYGTYFSENKETKYIFNVQGIWIETTIFNSISKDTIRESSKYTVRNGFILGVVLNDSLPCILDENRYHFGMKVREQVAGGNSKNVLKKLNSTSYLLNYKENDGFIPSLFSISGKTLSIQYFDYDTGTSIFDVIAQQSSKKILGMNYISLAPTKKEWKGIDFSKLFGDKVLYFKN